MKKVPLLVIAFAAAVPASLFARPNFSGYCQQGGQVVVTSSVQSVTKVQQSYPSCTISVLYTGGASGHATSSGTTLTWTDGTPFNANSQWAGLTITYNGSQYIIASVSSANSLTTTSSLGTNTSPLAWSMPATAPAAIYSDNASTPLANPFASSTLGYWSFYADNGTYNIKASGGGIPGSGITWGSVSGLDPLTVPLTVSSRSYIAAGQTFYQACANAAMRGLILVIDQTWYGIASSDTCPAVVQEGGGLIQPASEKTVTMPCPSVTFASQLFDTTSYGGYISFYTGCASPLPVQAWGVQGVTGFDSTAALNSAFVSAATNCSTLRVPAGNYKITSQISKARCVGLEGDGTTGTVIQFDSTSGVGLAIGDSNTASASNALYSAAIVRDLTISGIGSGAFTGNTSTCIWLGGDPNGTVFPSTYYGNFTQFQTVNVTGCNVGWTIGNNSWLDSWYSPFTSYNNTGWTMVANSTNNDENLNIFGGATFNNNVALYATYTMKFHSHSFDYNAQNSSSAWINNPYSVNFSNVYTDCHFEATHGPVMTGSGAVIYGGEVAIGNPSGSSEATLFNINALGAEFVMVGTEVSSAHSVTELIDFAPSSLGGNVTVLGLSGNGNVSIGASINDVRSYTNSYDVHPGLYGTPDVSYRSGATYWSGEQYLSSVSGAGAQAICDNTSGATTPCTFVRTINGTESWINNAFSNVLMSLDQSGNLSVAGSGTFNGNLVVNTGAQFTASGTSSFSGYATFNVKATFRQASGLAAIAVCDPTTGATTPCMNIRVVNGVLSFVNNAFAASLAVFDQAGNVTIAGQYAEQLFTPASSSAVCVTGTFSDDASYHYVCVATNTWKRVALASF